MGIVTKTHTQMVGDVTEEIQYYFESYEDFIKFENFIKVEESQVTNQVEKIFGVAGRRYRVIGNVMGHGFKIGEEVEALVRDMNGHISVSNGEKEYWMSKEELEEV